MFPPGKAVQKGPHKKTAPESQIQSELGEIPGTEIGILPDTVAEKPVRAGYKSQKSWDWSVFGAVM